MIHKPGSKANKDFKRQPNKKLLLYKTKIRTLDDNQRQVIKIYFYP